MHWSTLAGAVVLLFRLLLTGKCKWLPFFTLLVVLTGIQHVVDPATHYWWWLKWEPWTFGVRILAVVEAWWLLTLGEEKKGKWAVYGGLAVGMAGVFVSWDLRLQPGISHAQLMLTREYVQILMALGWMFFWGVFRLVGTTKWLRAHGWLFGMWLMEKMLAGLGGSHWWSVNRIHMGLVGGLLLSWAWFVARSGRNGSEGWGGGRGGGRGTGRGGDGMRAAAAAYHDQGCDER